LGAPLAEDQRADTIWVTEPEDAMTDDHGHHRITPTAAAVDSRERCEHVRRRDADGADALQLRGEHVQQHLRVGGGIQMTPVLADQDLGELGGVGEVAVVAETDAIGCIDVEGLRLGGAVAARRRIAYMADTHITLELEHVVLLKDIAHQAAAFAHAQLTLARGGGDAGSILAAVLQHRERIIETLVYGAGANNADDAAHELSALRDEHQTCTLCSSLL
jgi:hypothetical protein